MIKEIPITAENQIFEIELDAEMYKLELFLNTRMDRWFLSIEHIDTGKQINSIAITLGVNLLSNYKYDWLPNIILYAEDMTNNNIEANAENLGKDVRLFFELL